MSWTPCLDDACYGRSSGAGASTLCIQLAPDHTPREWPSGTQHQLHLDLWVDDHAVAHEHALTERRRSPPATCRRPHRHEQFIVCADPAGHPFCLCWYAKDTGLTSTPAAAPARRGS